MSFAYFNAGAKAHELSREVCRERNADNARGAFLRSLHQNLGSDSLTPFESEFLASFLDYNLKAEAGLDFKWFTPGRRKATDRMMKRYCAALPLPVGRVTPCTPNGGQGTSRPTLASTCDFLVRGEGHQQRCDQPATHCSADHKIAYCSDHAEQVQRGAWVKGKLVKQPVVPLVAVPQALRPDIAAAKFSQLRSAAGLAALCLVFHPCLSVSICG